MNYLRGTGSTPNTHRTPPQVTGFHSKRRGGGLPNDGRVTDEPTNVTVDADSFTIR